MRNKSVWLVLAFVFSLFACPVSAYASPLDSFSNGLHDFVSPDTETVEEVRYEQDFAESYVPQEVVLSAPATREYDEDSTTVDYVNGTLDSFNSVNWNIGDRSLVESLRLMFTNVATSTGFIVVAVGLVFMWWGVRKSVRMVFAAFRKGRSNV